MYWRMKLHLGQLCGIILFAVANGVMVVTPSGTIEGYKLGSPVISIFKGIPYAESPVRFEKSEMIKPWQGVKNATEFRLMCAQPSYAPMSEDCLFLNIFVPGDLTTTEKKAVMIWIHGGGVQVGSSNDYDGSSLAIQGDVIVVTINYRLNILGFLESDGTKPSNIGLWDQQLAFQWIQQNIEPFGGDTARVTIFGESGGSWSVALQTLSPVNDGTVFQRAIHQSGGGIIQPLARVDSTTTAVKMAVKLGCRVYTNTAAVECLKNMPLEELMLGIVIPDELVFLPVADGQFILEEPQKLLSDFVLGGIKAVRSKIGNLAEYDTLLGFNTQEGLSTFSDGFIIPSTYETITEDDWVKVFSGCIFGMSLDDSQRTLIAEMVASHYVGTVPASIASRRMDNQRLRMATDACGDLQLSWPTLETALLHSAAARGMKKTYFYELDFRRSSAEWLWDEGPEWLRTSSDHSDDLPLLFPFEVFSRNQEEIRLSKAIQTYWANFAKTGDPKTQSNAHRGAVVWPQLRENERNYVRFALNHDYNESRPLGGHADFWRSVLVAADRSSHKSLAVCESLQSSAGSILANILMLLSVLTAAII